MVISRSFSAFERARGHDGRNVAAEAHQPNGMDDLPCNPILCINLSMMKAARAM